MDTNKLIKLLNLISSDSDNEALVAAKAALKLIQANNTSWEKLLKQNKQTETDIKSYNEGYKAGFEKGSNLNLSNKSSWHLHKIRNDKNIVSDYKKVSRLFQDLMPVLKHMTSEEAKFVQYYSSYYTQTRFLFLSDYDKLKHLAKKYWDCYD